MIQQDKNIILSLEEYNKLLHKILILEEELTKLKRLIFGKKNERFLSQKQDEKQGNIFAEEQVQVIEKQEVITKEITIKQTKKQKIQPIRQVLPKHLRREVEIIEPDNLPENSKKIGEVITEVLEYKPSEIFVRSIIRPKYIIPQEEKITIAELPTLPIPRSNAGASLLSHIFISKFIDHLPYYRQCKIFKRQDIEISESTINDWFTATCKLLEPLYETLKKHIKQSAYIQADESPMPVLTKDKPGSTHKGYMWLYNSPPDKMVCFDYQTGRDQNSAKSFLENFKGILQTDGYVAYNVFGTNPHITLAACMAHVRRKFENSLSSYPDVAKPVMEEIQKLYEIERHIKTENLTPENIISIRKEKAEPIFINLEKYLLQKVNTVLPKSEIGKAINYALNLFPRLKVYLYNSQVQIDNNLIENAVRPLALGRKNYLFAGSHEAAKRNAMMYSFFGTCKLNNVEPYAWLKKTLEIIPDYNIQKLKELLPLENKLS